MFIAFVIFIISCIFAIAARSLAPHGWNVFKGYVLHPTQRGAVMEGVKRSKTGTIAAIATMVVCAVILVFAFIAQHNADNERDTRIIDAINNSAKTSTEAIINAIQQSHNITISK